MNGLFDQTTINGMTLRNRLVRSATWEGMCEDDGKPTEKLANLYRDLAAGEVGLIMTGYTFVRPDGKQLPRKMGIQTDDFGPDMEKMVTAVHDEGGKICIQLVHAGGQTDTATAGRKPFAPSAVKVEQFPEEPEELSTSEITAIIKAFGHAARRAKQWGFDAIQLHGAHGYLINQFLSPLTNIRTDDYGGDEQKRCRFLMEVYQEVRAQVGDDFPVLIKLNASDNMPGGLTVDQALIAAKKLSVAGIDAIEVSAGNPASDPSPVQMKINKPELEAYNLDAATRIKEHVSCPVMVVGGFRSFEIAEKAISTVGMDYISLARPFIREPDLAKRWQGGDHSAALCISCNGCFKPGLQEGGIYCVVAKKEKEKEQRNL